MQCFTAWQCIEQGLPLSQQSQNPLDLRGVYVQTGLGPDDEIGAGYLPFDGPLGPEALLDLLGRPTAVPEALMLCSGGTGDTDGHVQLGFSFSFKE